MKEERRNLESERKAVSSTHIPCYEGKEPISAVVIVYEDGSARILCPHTSDGRNCDLKGSCAYCK